MIYAFWGTLAGVAALFLWAAHQAIPTFGAPEPTGAHHRPPQPNWWQRWRDQRAQERAQDAVNARLIHDIHEGLRREATGPLTSSGMPRAEWPLMPLPPEVEHVREPYGHDAPGMPDDAYFCASDGEEWPCAAVAEDPHDVASGEDQADAYVGDLSTAVGASGPASNTGATSVEPAGPPLFDTSADHWGEDTLLGMPAVK